MAFKAGNIVEALSDFSLEDYEQCLVPSRSIGEVLRTNEWLVTVMFFERVCIEVDENYLRLYVPEDAKQSK